jgi:methylmalonyl-CoA mutase
MAKAIEAGHPQDAHRGGRRPHAGPHRQRPKQTVVGVNKYRLEEEDALGVLKVDNAEVREAADRAPEKAARRARQARRRGARRADEGGRDGRGQPARACVEAARARRRWARSATRWRRSSAATEARDPAIRGSTAARWATGRRAIGGAQAVEQFEEREGRRPAHPGRQDGPGRARPRAEGDRHGVRRPRLRRRHRPALPDARGGARQAVENDVHIVGVSSLAAGHLTLVPALQGPRGRGGARRHPDRRRRRDPAAGLVGPARDAQPDPLRPPNGATSPRTTPPR